MCRMASDGKKRHLSPVTRHLLHLHTTLVACYGALGSGCVLERTEPVPGMFICTAVDGTVEFICV